MTPCIAIIDGNTLSRSALQSMLEDIFDAAEIISFADIEAFHSDCNRWFVYFFISSDILLHNSSEFDTLKKETIVLNLGADSNFEQAGYKVLDLTRSERELAADIIQMHESGRTDDSGLHTTKAEDIFSEREKEVIRLVVKGHINKEIADLLNISLPTVVFHRNNIYEKLGSKSIGRLTIHAVLSGIVDIREI